MDCLGRGVNRQSEPSKHVNEAYSHVSLGCIHKFLFPHSVIVTLGGALAVTFSYNKIAYAVYCTLERLWEVERGVHGDVMMTSLVGKKM